MTWSLEALLWNGAASSKTFKNKYRLCSGSARLRIIGTYRNYLYNHIYTQLINDFIHDIIKQKTSVVATGKSASFLLESCGINENAFEELILINPDSIKAFRKAPSKRTKTACLILKLKIIGTFIYNKLNTKKCFEKRFEEDYFYDKEKIPEALSIITMNQHILVVSLPRISM